MCVQRFIYLFILFYFTYFNLIYSFILFFVCLLLFFFVVVVVVFLFLFFIFVYLWHFLSIFFPLNTYHQNIFWGYWLEPPRWHIYYGENKWRTLSRSCHQIVLLHTLLHADCGLRRLPRQGSCELNVKIMCEHNEQMTDLGVWISLIPQAILWLLVCLTSWHLT